MLQCLCSFSLLSQTMRNTGQFGINEASYERLTKLALCPRVWGSSSFLSELNVSLEDEYRWNRRGRIHR